MSSERSIPHLRDIFGLNAYTTGPTTPSQPIAHNRIGGNGSGGCSNLGSDGYDNHHNQPIDVRKQSRKKRDNSKTLTSGDVKTLERHLSMKKTIRKKIMRDLQQAFVDDPNEFKVDTTNSEHLKSEINVEALRFGENPTKKSDNFLVMLRGEQKSNYDQYSSNGQNRDYDYDSPKDEKQSFWKRFMSKAKR